jgi:hypothetical protein
MANAPREARITGAFASIIVAFTGGIARASPPPATNHTADTDTG